MELYASNNVGELGDFITSTHTNSEGWYQLIAPAEYEFYNIVQNDLPGYTSVGATSVSGSCAKCQPHPL